MNLDKVSLCVIVRDEYRNPAGGILDFINCHAPHVGEVVVVDTGSVDGTRDLLADLIREHANLKVHDHPFDGFAASRNFSLSVATGTHALILDADERLTKGDFEEMRRNFDPKRPAYRLNFEDIYPNTRSEGGGHPERFFIIGGFVFKNTFGFHGEYLFDSTGTKVRGLESQVTIRHFRATELAKADKFFDFLSPFVDTAQFHIPPSTVSTFKNWKIFNPQRVNYPGLPPVIFPK